MWSDKIEVKKGDIGENIVDEYLESKGWVIYKPTTDKAHLFDRFCVKEKKDCLIVEVKTKYQLKKLECNTITLNCYNDYLHAMKTTNLEVFLIFVDELSGTMYGNKISKLKEYIKIKKFKHGTMVLFPLNKMIFLKNLTDNEISNIKQYKLKHN